MKSKQGIEWKDLDQTQAMLSRADDGRDCPKLGNEILLSTARNKYLLVRLKRITKRAVWALTDKLKEKF